MFLTFKLFFKLMKAYRNNQSKVVDLSSGRQAANNMRGTNSAVGVPQVFSIKVLDRIVEIILYALIILIPAFFWPAFPESFELPKQIILAVGVSILLVVWLFKINSLKQISFVKSKLGISLLAFLLIYLLASLFSIDRISSFLGFYGRYTGSFVSVAFFIVLFFLVVNYVDSFEKIKRLLRAFSWASGLIVIFGMLQILGIYIFNIDIAKTPQFYLIGNSLVQFSIFIVASLISNLVLFFVSQKKVNRLVGLVFLAINIAAMIMLDVVVGWIALIASAIVLLAFHISQEEKKKSFINLAIALIVLAVVFSFISFKFIPTKDVSELALGQKASFEVASQTLKEKPILGSGPSTFYYDYNKYKPDYVNYSLLWATKFGKPGSEIADLLSGTGILGTLALAVFIGMYLVKAFKTISQADDFEKLVISYGLLSLVSMFVVSSFFYSFGTVLYFIFWLLIALGVASLSILEKENGKAEERTFSFEKSPQAAMLFSLAFMVSIALVIGVIYGSVKVASAEYYIYKADRALANKDLDSSIAHAGKAAADFKQRSAYHIIFSRLLLISANEIASGDKPDEKQISNLVTSAIAEAKGAVEYAPLDPNAWEHLAVVYRDAGYYTEGTWQLQKDSFAKAMELDPKDPILPTVFGNANIIESTRVQARMKQDSDVSGKIGEFLNNAIVEFNKSIGMKSDYIDAYLSLAEVYAKKGDYAKALNAAETAVKIDSSNLTALYKVGRIYYDSGDLNKAREQFEKVIEVYGKHADSLYLLGIIYDKQGERDKAIEAMQKVVDLNPDNENLLKKLDNLKSGKPIEGEDEAILLNEEEINEEDRVGVE